MLRLTYTLPLCDNQIKSEITHLVDISAIICASETRECISLQIKLAIWDSVWISSSDIPLHHEVDIQGTYLPFSDTAISTSIEACLLMEDSLCINDSRRQLLQDCYLPYWLVPLRALNTFYLPSISLFSFALAAQCIIIAILHSPSSFHHHPSYPHHQHHQHHLFVVSSSIINLQPCRNSYHDAWTKARCHRLWLQCILDS